MKVYVKNKNLTTDLNQNDFLAEGGQGKIFAKGNTVYKIYHDSTKIIPEGKIAELAALTMPNIIKPQDILVDKKGVTVGYTMPFIKNTFPLCKIFTKAFKEKEGVKPKQILHLVHRMQDTLDHIHSKRILVVDLNEMNFLVLEDFSEIYFIDVDSYQTPGFKPSALMESVRDRHSQHNVFSKETDYFALGIVTFQMFIGIHPYKGKHPSIQTLDERMLKNISVLNKDVRCPPTCYPFDTIPKAYFHWYNAIFEKGMRLPPPRGETALGNIVVQKTSGSNCFDVNELNMFNGNILNYFRSCDLEVVVTDQKIYRNNIPCLDGIKNPVIGFTKQRNTPLAAYRHNGDILVVDLANKFIYSCSGTNVMSYNDRIYIQSATSILELNCHEAKTDTLVSVSAVANIFENATQMFDGVVVQNLLGSYFISIFPETGQHQQIAVKELNGYAIIDGKFDNGVLMIVGVKNGKYDRFILRFAEDWSYDIRIVADVVYTGINFTVLESGICVSLREDGIFEIFAVKKDSVSVKEVDDPSLGDVKLFHNGTKVLFARENKLYSMTMRK